MVWAVLLCRLRRPFKAPGICRVGALACCPVTARKSYLRRPRCRVPAIRRVAFAATHCRRTVGRSYRRLHQCRVGTMDRQWPREFPVLWVASCTAPTIHARRRNWLRRRDRSCEFTVRRWCTRRPSRPWRSRRGWRRRPRQFFVCRGGGLATWFG